MPDIVINYLRNVSIDHLIALLLIVWFFYSRSEANRKKADEELENRIHSKLNELLKTQKKDFDTIEKRFDAIDKRLEKLDTIDLRLHRQEWIQEWISEHKSNPPPKETRK